MPSKITTPEGKPCLGCKKFLPLDNFHTQQRDGKTYYQSYCKPCQRENARRFMQTPRGKELIRMRNLLADFGLTVEQYDAMLEAQGGLCAICRRPERHVYRGKPRMLCVDHCHATGRVRGLLCSTCNRAIGLLEDDSNLLRAALFYLEKHAADQLG